MTSPTPQAMEALPELPPLPAPDEGWCSYTPEQTQAYARTAVSAALAAAQAEQAMGEGLTDEQIREIGVTAGLSVVGRDGDALLWVVRRALATRPSPTVEQASKVLVPIQMTAAMQRVVMEEEWEWADVLAACDAVTEEQYDEALVPPSPQPQDTDWIDVELTDAELGKIAYDGFDNYWTEDCAGNEMEAWAASAHAVLAARVAKEQQHG